MTDRFNAEVFLAIAELGSYRKAADKLGYTQAGIKYIVDAMEEEAGMKFFAREYGGVSLTENGKDILPWVRQLKASLEALDTRISELAHLSSGKVKVMCFNSVMVYWIPGIIKEFHERYPGIEVELISCDRFDEMEDAVYRREADCGFFHIPAKLDLETVLLSKEPMLAAFSKDHPLNDVEGSNKDKGAGANPEKVIRPEMLTGQRYIGPPLEMDPGIREFFGKYGIEPVIGFSTENDNAAMAMASKGLGFCIYPEFVLEGSGYPLVTAGFEEPLIWEIGLGVRSFETCSMAAKAFIDCAVSWIRNMK